MKGNRPKTNNETIPDIEVKHHKHVVEVRYDFEEVPASDIEGEEMPASFNFEFVKIPQLTKKDLKVAIIRKQYDVNDEMAAINDGDTNYLALRSKADEVWNKINS